MCVLINLTSFALILKSQNYTHTLFYDVYCVSDPNRHLWKLHIMNMSQKVYIPPPPFPHTHIKFIAGAYISELLRCQFLYEDGKII